MTETKVIILLASYNGSKYIQQQLDSIIAQTYVNWELYIRDDGSTDDTIHIIKKYTLLDNRIQLLVDNKGNLRSSLNFNALMEYCQDFGDYFMFCDQDDIWLENKVEETLKNMFDIEKDKPALVFGTQILIDENNQKINLEPRNYNFDVKLEILLTTNFIYGCTMMINKDLLKKCISIPKSAENHDYWIALVAATCKSNIKYISAPLMLYRQHNSNVSGSFKDSSIKNRFKRLVENKEIEYIKKRTQMFEDLILRSNGWLDLKDKGLIEGFNNIIPKGGIKAICFLKKNKIKKINRLSNLNYYLSILRA